ncbi:MAG: DoxX family protein [Bacteroidales bacterium]|nr:DoxX family protein [Bacteroidales bacterium]
MRQYRYSTSTTRRKNRDGSFFIRNGLRIFMGLLFIGSAYVKMVDPFGFALKIEEYFISFSLNFMTPTSMFFAFAAILAEFMIGWALLLNIQMQITAWVLLLFMIFFTLLTCYLAYFLDVLKIINNIFGTNFERFMVTDCGCFGDFIKLTNYQTFYKNIIFLLFAIIIFRQRKKYKQQEWYYITQWGPILLSVIFALFVMIHCLLHEPWHDFRPWKVGNFIAGETYSEAPEIDFVFQYKNNQTGKIEEFSIDKLSAIADDSLQNAEFEAKYTYIKRSEKVITPGINARLADFSITNNEGTDIKNMVMLQDDLNFIIFIRNLAQMNENKLKNIKALISDCKAEGIPYILLTSSSPYMVDSLNLLELDSNESFFFCDATPMKTALRNDPGVVMLQQGYILDKWAFRDVPALSDILAHKEQYDNNLQKYRQKTPPIFMDATDSINIENTPDYQEIEN